MIDTAAAFAAGEPAAAPYAFDEFERRDRRRRSRRAAWQRGVAASFAVAGVALLVAVVRTPPEVSPVAGAPTVASAAARPAVIPDAVVPEFDEPAIVDLSQLAQRSDIEDRIAWFDMQLTEGRAMSAPADEIARLSATRAQLEASLHQVSYAHLLMTL